MSPKRWIPTPERFNVAECSCGARIVWVEGSRGGKMALDRARERQLPGGPLELEPHWGYCPDRDRHRQEAVRKRRRAAPRCYDEACSKNLSAGDLEHGRPFCRSHWGKIPHSVRAWILRTFRPEQHRRNHGASKEFLEAADAGRVILRNRRRGAGVTPNLFGEDADSPIASEYD